MRTQRDFCSMDQVAKLNCVLWRVVHEFRALLAPDATGWHEFTGKGGPSTAFQADNITLPQIGQHATHMCLPALPAVPHFLSSKYFSPLTSIEWPVLG